MINALQYLNEISVLFALCTFFYISVKNYHNKVKATLEEVLAKGISASAIPTGLALLICAFDPSLLQGMSGFNIHIATAGFALIYISVKAASPGKNIGKASDEQPEGTQETAK